MTMTLEEARTFLANLRQVHRAIVLEQKHQQHVTNFRDQYEGKIGPKTPTGGLEQGKP